MNRKALLKKYSSQSEKKVVIGLGVIVLCLSLLILPPQQALFVFFFIFSVILFLFSPFYFLIFTAAFLPLYYGRGEFFEIEFGKLHFNLDGLKNLFFIFLFFGWYLFQGRKKIDVKKSFLGIPLLALLVWALIRIFPSFNQAGFSLVLSLGFYLGCYLVALTELKEPKHRVILIKAISIALMFNLLVFYWQILQIGIGDILAVKVEAKGLFSHSGSLAVFLAIAFPLFLFRDKIVNFFASVLILITIFLTFIRSVWLAVLTFLCLASLFLKKKFLLYLLGGFLIAVLILPQTSNYLFFSKEEFSKPYSLITGTYKNREKMWQDLLAQLKGADWLLGKGSGFSAQYIRTKPQYNQSEYFTAHSTWLEVLVDWGLLGIGAFVFLLFKIIMLFNKSKTGKAISLNCLLILLITGSLLSLINMVSAFVYWFLVLALVEAEEFRTHFLFKTM